MKNDTEINKNDKSNSNERLLNKILNTFKLGKDVFLRKNFCDSDTLFKLGLPYIQSPIEIVMKIKKISLFYKCYIHIIYFYF